MSEVLKRVLIAYNILRNKKYYICSSPLPCPHPLYCGFPVQGAPRLLVFDKTVNSSTLPYLLIWMIRVPNHKLLLSNRSQISCQVSKTMATPRALSIKASKVCTILKNVIFGNSRTEERSFCKGLSYNIRRRAFRAFR